MLCHCFYDFLLMEKIKFIFPIYFVANLDEKLIVLEVHSWNSIDIFGIKIVVRR